MPRDPDLFDFFVSYARKDNFGGWISGFVEELLAEHWKFSGGRALVPFFDTQDIGSFDDWRLRIYDSLTRSRLFLAFISPNYFVSEWCCREWRAWIDTEIAKHILSSGAAPVYIVEGPGLDNEKHGEDEVAGTVAELCGIPPTGAPLLAGTTQVIRQLRRRQLRYVTHFFREGLSALRREDLRCVLQRLARDLEGGIEHLRRAAASESTLPPYNKRFSGRIEELLALRERLKDDWAGVISGVHGLGGIGKTELALTYAHAFAGAYPGGRFLVPCEGKTDLRDAVLYLGDLFRDRIRDEDRKTGASYFAAITVSLRERLDRLGHILIVLDNVTDPTLLKPQWTDALTALGPTLHLLATTRIDPGVGRVTRHADWVTLGELPEEASLELLEKHRPFANEIEREAARKIAKRLGGFTLAVELVAAWLAKHPEVTCAAFLERLGLEDLEALETLAEDRSLTLRRHDHERRLDAVLEPVLAVLGLAERHAMEYASLLPPDQVPLPWLRELVARGFPEVSVRPRPGYPDLWEEICANLHRLGLVHDAKSVFGKARVVRAHRLVQDLVRRALERDDLKMREMKRELAAFVVRRAEMFSVGWADPEGRWEADALTAYFHQAVDDGSAQALEIGAMTGAALDRLGRRIEALEVLDRCVAAFDEIQPESEIRAACLQTRSVVEMNLDRLIEAERDVREAIKLLQAAGSGTRGLMDCYSTLSGVLRGLGKTIEGRDTILRAISLHESMRLPENISLSMLLSNLANFNLDLCQPDEARRLLERTVAIQRREGGAAFPNLAISLCNLARSEHDLRLLPEARQHAQEALALAKQVHPGEQHPEIASILTQLAAIERDEGYLDQAEHLFREALGIRRAAFPGDHSDMVESLTLLSTVLNQEDQLDEARARSLEALDIQLRLFPGGHPHTGGIYHNLGLIELTSGNDSKARELFDRAIEARRASGMADHWETASSLLHRGKAELELGLHLEAHDSFQQCVKLREKIFGERAAELAHPLAFVARALCHLGRRKEAAHAAERSNDLLATRGQSIPDREELRLVLAMVEAEIGDPRRALELAKTAADEIQSQQRKLDARDAFVLNELAAIMRAAGAPDLALDTFERALEIRSALGQDALSLAVGHHNLAAVQGDLGKHRDALRNIREAIRLREGRMRADHPDMGLAYEILGLALEGVGELEEAREKMQKAVQVLERSTNPKAPVIAETLSYLGRVHMKLGDLERAREAHEESLRRLREMDRPPANSLAFTLNELCIVLCRLGKPHERGAMLEEAVRLRVESGQCQPRDLAVNHHNLGVVQYEEGDLKAARQSWLRSLDIKRTLVAGAPLELAGTLRQLGYVERDLGIKGARGRLEEALRIFESVHGVDHPDTVAVRRILRSFPDD